jgi:hypothetical protein
MCFGYVTSRYTSVNQFRNLLIYTEKSKPSRDLNPFPFPRFHRVPQFQARQAEAIEGKRGRESRTLRHRNKKARENAGLKCVSGFYRIDSRGLLYMFYTNVA